MSALGASLPAAAWAGPRTRVAGSAYLALAGLVNAATGALLVWLAGSDPATRWFIDLFVGSLGELGGLYRGGLIAALASWLVVLLGVLALVLAGGQLLSAWRAYGGRESRRAIVVSLVGSLNPLALPPGLVAAGLLFLSRDASGDADAAGDADVAGE